MTESSKTSPEVAAVVVTWNDVDMAAGCVRSLKNSDQPGLSIIVVDNGSVEPCGERIKEQHPEVELIVLARNQGFTGGSNAGLRRGVETGAKFVQLYNNDTVVEPTTISRMVAAFQRYPDLGAASPVLLYPDDGARREIVGFYRGHVDRELARHEHDEMEVPYGSRSWPDIESSFVPFCATMFRTSALEKVGFLDESLGTCWEDYDMCLRLADAGYTIMTVGDARVVHFVSKTTGKRSPYIIYYMTRNRMICLFRYNHPMTIVKRSPMLVRTLGWQVRKYGLDWSRQRAFGRGLVDFVLGRRGEDPRALAMRRAD